MLERRIATYDKTNFRKRLNEFLEVAKIYKQDDLNEHNIYQVLYKTEQFRNAIYKCIKLKADGIQPLIWNTIEICVKSAQRSCSIIRMRTDPNIAI